MGGDSFMSKILITSIGEGRFDKESNEKDYKKAKYYIEPNRDESLETAYIYEALLKFYPIDKIIFVGTCGSNWHLFYEHLYETNYSKITPQICRDDDYSLKLWELYEDQPRYKKDPAEMQVLLKEKIPAVLPGNDFLQKEKEVFASLGDIITTNQWSSFKSVVDKCVAIRDKQEKIGIKNYIFNDIADNFAEARNDEMLLRLTLAKWYATKTRYIIAAITAVEAVITYGVNLAGLKMTDANRDTIRKRLNTGSVEDPVVKNFLSLYNHIRFKIRNPLSHASSQKTDIKAFQGYLENLCGVYKGQFKANTDKPNILGRVLSKR
jgi:hypothetical protein